MNLLLLFYCPYKFWQERFLPKDYRPEAKSLSASYDRNKGRDCTLCCIHRPKFKAKGEVLEKIERWPVGGG
jgi:hypothetical protein